jgi:hypothetical protein
MGRESSMYRERSKHDTVKRKCYENHAIKLFAVYKYAGRHACLK